MGLAVVTVAAGGLPVVEHPFGVPVTEAANRYGVPVTKVIGKPGLPVVFETIGVFTATTFDGTATNVTLSNGNLTATHSTTAASSGVRSLALKSVGKFYVEFLIGVTTGTNNTYGVLRSDGNFGSLNTGTLCAVATTTGAVFGNNANSGKTIGTVIANDIIGAAINLDARKVWFRRNGGLWNGLAIGVEDPAANLGGVAFAATNTFSPAVGFSGTGGTIGEAVTMNAGPASFAAAVPTGFTAGWSV